MKHLIVATLSILLTTNVALGQQAGAQKIKDCKNSPQGEAVCTALVLNRKLNRVLKQNSAGGSGGALKGKVQFYNEKDCKEKMGGLITVFADSLEELKQQCSDAVQSISGYQNIDAVGPADGTCEATNDNPNKQNLTDYCVGMIF